MQRLRGALNLESDKQLAAALGLKANAFYNRKSSGSLPFENVLDLADKHQMCVDWIFFGLGNPFREPGAASVKPVASVDEALMGEVGLELARAFQGYESTSAGARVSPSPIRAPTSSARSTRPTTASGATRSQDQAGLERAHLHSLLAAMIYNKTAFIENAKLRSKAVRTEALSMASVVELSDKIKSASRSPGRPEARATTRSSKKASRIRARKA